MVKAHRRALLTPPSAAGWFALTGTPGCGKSSAARRLHPSDGPIVEVADLALRLGTSRTLARGGVEVDLRRSAERFRRGRGSPRGIVVGHLAHLLPIRNSIVLRCHPIVLERRLRRSSRFDAQERFENTAAEALDLILVEAVSRRRRIWELDTTGRSPDRVARAIHRILRGGVRPGRAGVDWLADPTVTEYLLRPPR